MNKHVPIKLAFLGDIRFPTPCGANVGDPFARVRSWLEDADLVVANLEGPIDSGDVPRQNRGAILHNDSAVLGYLGKFPRCVVTLGNNHIMDYGREGLDRTLRKVSDSGLLFVGAGMDESTANAPLVLSFGDARVGFVSLTTSEKHVGSLCASGENEAGTGRWCTTGDSLRVIADLKREIDFVCVLLHWGHEFYEYPTPAQVESAMLLARAGADLIVCHHPHVIQGMQRTGRSLVAYSLGNCIFPPFEMTNGRVRVQSAAEKEFMLLKCTLHHGMPPELSWLAGRLNRRVELIPYSSRRARKFSIRMDQLSAPMGREDYNMFYERYAGLHERALQLRALRHAFLKVTLRNLLSIRSTDIKRQWDRLLNRKSSHL